MMADMAKSTSSYVDLLFRDEEEKTQADGLPLQKALWTGVLAVPTLACLNVWWWWQRI